MNGKTSLTPDQQDLEDLKNNDKMSLSEKQMQEIILLLRRIARALESFK
jgi:hypothetical protein